jgi:hypothetical protein
MPLPALRATRPIMAIFTIVVSCLATAGAAEAEPAQAVGRLEHVRGEVRIVRGAVARQADTGTVVLRRDRIETGPASRVALALPEGSRLLLGENGALIVEDAMAGEGRQRATVMLTVPRGAFRINMPVLGPGIERMAMLRTPLAVLSAARGELWAGPRDGGLAVLAVYGEVHVRNAAGSQVLSRKRLGTFVQAGNTAPTLPQTWDRAQVESALFSVALD